MFLGNSKISFAETPSPSDVCYTVLYTTPLLSPYPVATVKMVNKIYFHEEYTFLGESGTCEKWEGARARREGRWHGVGCLIRQRKEIVRILICDQMFSSNMLFTWFLPILSSCIKSKVLLGKWLKQRCLYQ